MAVYKFLLPLILVFHFTLIAQQGCEFPGGPGALECFVESKLDISLLRTLTEPGAAVAKITIDKKGYPHPAVLQSYNAALDSSLLQALRQMPQWKPYSDQRGNGQCYTNYAVIIPFKKRCAGKIEFTESAKLKTETLANGQTRYTYYDTVYYTKDSALAENPTVFLPFKNNSQTALTINYIKSSDPCVASNWIKQPVKPGSDGFLMIQCPDLLRYRNAFSTTFEIYYDSGTDEPLILVVRKYYVQRP